MKKLNHVVLGKWVFASVKGCVCLRKGHSDNPEGQVKVESPLFGSCF